MSSDFVIQQNSLRRNKRAPTLDSTLAMDANNSVIGTSYHQLDDSTVSTPLSARHLIAAASAPSTAAGGSRGSTPLPSPRHSRQGSAAASGSSSIPARPGPIDNACLILQPDRGSGGAAGGKVTSLTAEGGKLRGAVSRERGVDMVFVPERLWRALVQWYGGSPVLPRQVIR